MRDLEEYEQIDEKLIRQRAEMTRSKSLNHLLEIAEEWREADCTPVFIVAQNDPMVIACVAIERFGKPYH